MTLPDFILNLPALDVPFPEDVVSAHALRSDDALAVFFRFHKDMELPAHSHGPQWGTVIKGQIQLTIDGVTRTYGPGESYDIPNGVEHAVKVAAGTIAVDLFAEADRYPLKPRT